MQKEINKLRIRFILSVIIVVSLVIALVSGIIIRLASAAIEEMGDRVLSRVVVSPQNFGTLLRDDDDDIQLPYFVVVVDEHFAVLTRYGGYYDLSDTASMQAALDKAIGSSLNTGYIPEYGLRFLKISGGLGMTNIAFIDVSSQLEYLAHLKIITYSAYVACVLIFAILALILSKWVIKPVENSWNQQKQFVSDASHELKTPLTIINTNAEMLQLENCTEEDKRKYSQNILTVAQQMRALVEDLLNLARLEKGDIQNFETVVFSNCVNESLMQFEPVLYELGLNLVEEIEEDIKVRGSDQRLRQLTSILLDNAGKYSLPGDVRVRLYSQGRHACLSVSNPSEVINGEQLKNLFTRFYRLDESRNKKNSYGLGLSIAKSIVEAHNGKIAAEYKNGVLCMSVVIPVA